MEEKEIKEKIKQGYLRINVMFEVIGNPKEHVVKALKEYLKQIKTNPNFVILKEDYAAPIEKEGLWSTFCEAELLVYGFEKLSWLCINFTPGSVEILEPEVLSYKNTAFTSWINDLLSKLHEIGVSAKAISSKNQMLQYNINMITRNCVLALLDKESSEEELANKLGLPVDTITSFINLLIKEKKIRNKGKKFIKDTVK